MDTDDQDESMHNDPWVPTLSPGFRRFFSRNAEEKRWRCSTCGDIAPLALANGWYVRRPCACEIQARAIREAEEQRRNQRHLLAEQIYAWLGHSWSSQALRQHTFASFCCREQNASPAVEQMRFRAWERAQSFARTPQGVFVLYGPPGTGKTHLLAAMANGRGEGGHACLFASAISLFDAIGDRISNEREYHTLIKRALTTPLLLLDDVDKPKPSRFREDIYYTIINGRTTAGFPLAISANVAPDALAPYVGRAACSRLMMGLIPVPMYGPDYRIRMNERGLPNA